MQMASSSLSRTFAQRSLFTSQDIDFEVRQRADRSDDFGGRGHRERETLPRLSWRRAELQYLEFVTCEPTGAGQLRIVESSPPPQVQRRDLSALVLGRTSCGLEGLYGPFGDRRSWWREESSRPQTSVTMPSPTVTHCHLYRWCQHGLGRQIRLVHTSGRRPRWEAARGTCSSHRPTSSAPIFSDGPSLAGYVQERVSSSTVGIQSVVARLERPEKDSAIKLALLVVCERRSYVFFYDGLSQD